MISQDLFFSLFLSGKGVAIYKTKLKNLLTKYTEERTFRVSEKIKKLVIERKEMLFSYESGGIFFFLDLEDGFSEVSISRDDLSKLEIDYEALVEGTQYEVSVYHTDKILTIGPSKA